MDILLWEDSPTNDATSYLVYREEVGGEADVKQSIIKNVDRSNYNAFVFIDKNVDLSRTYVYAVTALDKAYNESKPREQ